MSAPIPRTCGDSGGRTLAGSPCRSTLNLGSDGMCIQHSPLREAERAALRVAGGKAAGVAKRKAKAAEPDEVPAEPKSLADAVRIASWVTRAVLIGKIDVRVAEAATKAVRQFQLGEEKARMERELRDLRREVASLRKSEARGGARLHSA